MIPGMEIDWTDLNLINDMSITPFSRWNGRPTGQSWPESQRNNIFKSPFCYTFTAVIDILLHISSCREKDHEVIDAQHVDLEVHEGGHHWLPPCHPGQRCQGFIVLNSRLHFLSFPKPFLKRWVRWSSTRTSLQGWFPRSTGIAFAGLQSNLDTWRTCLRLTKTPDQRSSLIITTTLKVTPENYEGDLDFLRKAHHALLEVCEGKIYSEE